MIDIVALTEALVRARSISPEDAGCQALIGEHLRILGFTVEALPFGPVKNLWATRGDATGPLFVFAGHTDVVPSGDPGEWQSPPFEPVIRDGLLYGRGTADMKGSLAAMLHAVEAFTAEVPDPAGRIGFLITSDEEADAVDGTVRVMAELHARGEHIDWCIVGEPSSTELTGDVVRVGRRGSLGGTLTVRGTQGHVAYPERVDNPIHRTVVALTALTGEHWDAGNSYFPPTSLQVSNITSGTGATNVVPGTLTALFNFRFSTECTAESLTARTHAILDAHLPDYEIDWTLSGEPFLTGDGALVDAVTDTIRSECGYSPELSTSGGTSDGRFIAPYGTQLIELGPRNETIHKVDECVDPVELVRLAGIYRGVLHRLLTA